MTFRRLRLRKYNAGNGFAQTTYVAFSHGQAAQMFAAEHPDAMDCAPSSTVHVWRLDEPVSAMKGVSV